MTRDAVALDSEPDSAPADANGAVPDAMALGELVRTRREARGWTQDDLAERAGLTRVDVSRVETGYNQGSSHRMRVALAKGFGVETEELESFLAQTANGAADEDAAQETVETVGQLIRALYLSRGFNRHSFAKAIKASYTTVNAWEKGGIQPDIGKLRATVAALGLSEDESSVLWRMSLNPGHVEAVGAQPSGAAEPLSPFAERVMLAYRCLPRGKHGRLPSFRSIEQAAKLPPSTFSKLSLGHRTDAMAVHTMTKLAAALGVSTGWLATGEGRGPETTSDGAPSEAPADDAPGLGERLRLTMERTGFSARELSLKAGLAQGHVGMLMREAHAHTAAATLSAIAAAASVSFAWLATGEGAPELPAAAPRRLCALPGWEHALAGAVRLAPSLPAGLFSAAGECAIVAPDGAHMEPTPELVAAIATALAAKGAAR